MTRAPAIILDTNFTDYYDYVFDYPTLPSIEIGTDYHLLRDDRAGPDKKEQLTLLTQAGLQTPRSGSVRSLANLPDPPDKVMVYRDLRKHRGEGKVVLTIEEAMAQGLEDRLCTAYMSGDFPTPVSWRYLSIGSANFWIEYRGDRGYMSNHARQVAVSTLAPRESPRLAIDRLGPSLRSYPLLAIDFVRQGGTLFAIDLNCAPRIQNTQVEELLPPRAIYDLVRGYLTRMTDPPLWTGTPYHKVLRPGIGKKFRRERGACEACGAVGDLAVSWEIASPNTVTITCPACQTTSTRPAGDHTP